MHKEIKGFLGASYLNLPYENKTEGVLELLDIKYGLLLNDLQKLEETVDWCSGLYKSLKYSTEQIIKTITLYLAGNISEAYLMLNHMLLSIQDEIKIVSECYKKFSGTVFYRMRLNSLDSSLQSRSGYLHIPFELRHKVSNYRYSIAGIPCVYMGATIYTCYEELRSPGYDNIHVARIEIPKEYNLLTIGLLPWEVNDIRKERLGFNNEFYYAYIKMLPLIMACSIKVGADRINAVFKEEYIVPQLVMQWLLASGTQFDGIIYFSTATKTKSVLNHRLYQNVVLPVKQIDKNGYCKQLAEELKVSKPFDNTIAKIELYREDYEFEMDDSDRRGYVKTKSCGRISEDISKGEIHYSSSGFRYIEYLLSKEEMLSVVEEELRN